MPENEELEECPKCGKMTLSTDYAPIVEMSDCLDKSCGYASGYGYEDEEA